MASSDLITKMPANQLNIASMDTWEATLDLVGNVTGIDILLKYDEPNDGDPAKTLDDLVDVISNVHIEPTGMNAAVDISGKFLLELMRSKFPGKAYAKKTVTTSSAEVEVHYVALFKLLFTDYMNKLDLSIPESAKSLNVKIEFAHSTFHSDPFLTVRVIQDKQAKSTGYRRYFQNSIPIPENSYKNQVKDDIRFPKFGMLDSFMIHNIDGEPINEIKLMLDDIQVPLHTTGILEKMNAQLHNDEEFDSNLIYCDLARPILAQKAKSLKLEVGFGDISADCTLDIMYEYVHFTA